MNLEDTFYYDKYDHQKLGQLYITLKSVIHYLQEQEDKQDAS